MQVLTQCGCRLALLVLVRAGPFLEILLQILAERRAKDERLHLSLLDSRFTVLRLSGIVMRRLKP